MQAGKYLSMMVFTWGDDDVVPVIQPPKSSLKFDLEGVYVLVGGLGGVERSLSKKLVHLEARKLCFFSHSGAKSAASKEVVMTSSSWMSRYKLLCATSPTTSQLQPRLPNAHKKLVPFAESSNIRIREQALYPVHRIILILGAMVRRDTLFVKLTHQQWLEAARPKVQGSWNLHTHLPDVDFLISLSSFSAVNGNRGQANYGAAGGYDDALAQHRRAQGQRVTTFDLGIMRDIGVLAQTGITESLMAWEKPYGIREPEFHALMERAIDGDIQGISGAQVITGIATDGSAIAAGIDAPFYLDSKRFSIMALTGTRNQISASKSASDSASAPTHTLIAAAESRS